MEEIISKEELEEFKKIKGEIRGMALKSALDFVLKREGRDGLRKVENVMIDLGYPVEHNKINIMNFYSLIVETILFAVIKELFNYNEKDFYEMGEFQFRMPITIRLYMKYLSSVNSVVKAASKMYRIYFTIGNLGISEYNEKEKYMIVKLEDFYFHAAYLYCQIFRGFFPSVIQMVVKTPVSCKETKCVDRGDEYHEFLLKW